MRCAVSPWNSHWLALWTRTRQKHTCLFHAVCNVSREAFVSHPAWQEPSVTGSQYELGYWVLVHYKYLWCWLYRKAQWEFQYTKLNLFLWEAVILAPIHNPWNSAGPKPQPYIHVFSLGPQHSFLILVRLKLWLLYYLTVSKTFPAYALKENLAEKNHSKKIKCTNDS